MPLSIIGAGLPRTGNTSLKSALEQLGLGPCYHMKEVRANPSSVSDWERAFDGDPDWETIFKGYRASMDAPACLFYRELAAYYPKAKIILTIRDPERWQASMVSTVLSEEAHQDRAGTRIADLAKKIVARAPWMISQDKAEMTAFFEDHVAGVQNAISTERLLIYRTSDGWPPLCNFLGVAVPETEFPHANAGEAYRVVRGEIGA